MTKTLTVTDTAVREAVEEHPESKCLLKSLFPDVVGDFLDDIQILDSNGAIKYVLGNKCGDIKCMAMVDTSGETMTMYLPDSDCGDFIYVDADGYAVWVHADEMSGTGNSVEELNDDGAADPWYRGAQEIYRKFFERDIKCE